MKRLSEPTLETLDNYRAVQGTLNFSSLPGRVEACRFELHIDLCPPIVMPA